MKKVKPILVTGGAGFIGSHLVERLLAEGKKVVVIDDLSTGSLDNLRTVKSHPRLRVVQSKISACAGLPKLAANAEFIFHLAATVGVELVVKSALSVLESSFHETQVLLRAAAARRTPLLLTSTSEVYGKSQKHAFGEDDDLLIGPPGQSRWSYACSKLTDEFLALAYAREKSLPVIIARLFNTVGPRQTGRYGMVLPRFIAAAKKGEPLKVFGDGTQTRCFLPRRRRGGSTGTAAKLSEGARRNFQRRWHGGSQHPQTGATGGENAGFKIEDSTRAVCQSLWAGAQKLRGYRRAGI